MPAKDVFKPKDLSVVEHYLKRIRIKERKKKFIIQLKTLWGWGWWVDMRIMYDGELSWSLDAEEYESIQLAQGKIGRRIKYRYFRPPPPPEFPENIYSVKLCDLKIK